MAFDEFFSKDTAKRAEIWSWRAACRRSIFRWTTTIRGCSGTSRSCPSSFRTLRWRRRRWQRRRSVMSAAEAPQVTHTLPHLYIRRRRTGIQCGTIFEFFNVDFRNFEFLGSCSWISATAPDRRACPLNGRQWCEQQQPELTLHYYNRTPLPASAYQRSAQKKTWLTTGPARRPDALRRVPSAEAVPVAQPTSESSSEHPHTQEESFQSLFPSLNPSF